MPELRNQPAAGVHSVIGFLLVPAIFFLFSCSRVVYIVRHAEKATTADTAKMMGADPALSDAGKVRAFVLRDELKSKHIRHIYSTNTIRTMSTARPLSEAIKITIDNYRDIDSLVAVIKAQKGNALVVGHADTVDDIINKLCGQKKLSGDLANGEYDNLFMVKWMGKKAHFSRKKYGYPSNP